MRDVSEIKQFPIAERIKSQFLQSDPLFPGKSESARVSRVYLRLFACSLVVSMGETRRYTTARNFFASRAERRRAIDVSRSRSPLGNISWRTTMRCHFRQKSRANFFSALTFFHNQINMPFKIARKSRLLSQVRNVMTMREYISCSMPV